MIIRIVKMTFREEAVGDFLQIFDSSSSMIRNFKGCTHLELLKDTRKPNTYFTYSYWDSAEDLDNYRNSPLFDSVWKKTTALFAEKPAAWSLDRVRQID